MAKVVCFEVSLLKDAIFWPWQAGAKYINKGGASGISDLAGANVVLACASLG